MSFFDEHTYTVGLFNQDATCVRFGDITSDVLLPLSMKALNHQIKFVQDCAMGKC